jgi:hypothetical protein
LEKCRPEFSTFHSSFFASNTPNKRSICIFLAKREEALIRIMFRTNSRWLNQFVFHSSIESLQFVAKSGISSFDTFVKNYFRFQALFASVTKKWKESSLFNKFSFLPTRKWKKKKRKAIRKYMPIDYSIKSFSIYTLVLNWG